ncbi:FlgD immunoglobulin-like domain containing protein, partial [Candidatus Latescibacterota bacterium]
MRRSAFIMCALLILMISYSAVRTSGNAENFSSYNAVCVFGIVIDSTSVIIPYASVTFTSSVDTIRTFSDESGMYSVLLPKDPTGVEYSTPETFTLRQNYPNPFNPSTIIEYSLDEPSSVNLDIFSITGQHVRSLAHGTESPGMHSVVWDGRNDTGTSVAAGIYLYRLRSGVEIQTKKMVLVDGAVTNPGFSGQISAPSVKKGAEYDSDKEYDVFVEKSTMIPYRETIVVSSDQSEIEMNIVLQDKYIPYSLFFTSNNYNNYFIYPGESFGVTLIGIHEQDYPQDCQVTLHSGTGDLETLTLSVTDYWGNFGICGESVYYPDIRRGSIDSSSDLPVQHNGVIEVDAHADTIFVEYTFPYLDSITSAIVAIDSLNTIVLWDQAYVHWGNEWYLASETSSWER